VSTHSQNKEQAEKVAKESGIEQLEYAARADSVTSKAVVRLIAGKNITCERAFKEWIQWLKAKSGSVHTISLYQRTVELFMRDMQLKNRGPAEITTETISSWINSGSNRKINTLNSYLNMLIGFCEFLYIKGYAFSNVAKLATVHWQNLTHQQKETKHREPLTNEEMAALIDAADNKFQSDILAPGYLSYAIRMARYLGLRSGDCAMMEWESFAHYGYIEVWTHKRNVKVKLKLEHPEVIKALTFVPTKSESKYLWPLEAVYASDPDSRVRLQGETARLFYAAGVKGKSFHCLRHTYATECWNAGKTMEHISKDLGHQSHWTTQNYVHKSVAPVDEFIPA
jgi:integrase